MPVAGARRRRPCYHRPSYDGASDRRGAVHRGRRAAGRRRREFPARGLCRDGRARVGGRGAGRRRRSPPPDLRPVGRRGRRGGRPAGGPGRHPGRRGLPPAPVVDRLRRLLPGRGAPRGHHHRGEPAPGSGRAGVDHGPHPSGGDRRGHRPRRRLRRPARRRADRGTVGSGRRGRRRRAAAARPRRRRSGHRRLDERFHRCSQGGRLRPPQPGRRRRRHRCPVAPR